MVAGLQADQEAAELGDADRDQGAGRRCSPFWPVVVARSAGASRASVTCRCQPVQERTSY